MLEGELQDSEISEKRAGDATPSPSRSSRFHAPRRDPAGHLTVADSRWHRRRAKHPASERFCHDKLMTSSCLHSDSYVAISSGVEPGCSGYNWGYDT